jgi:predicted GIY-YIG superfamily endonuclease
LAEHRLGEGCEWTRKRLPIQLVFSLEMPDQNQAYVAEHMIKKWLCGRAYDQEMG